MIEPLLEAERAMDMGLLDQAERLFRGVADADPRNSIAVVGLSRVALERGEEAKALVLARRAAEIDPANPMAARMVARLEEILATRGRTPGAGARVAAVPASSSPRHAASSAASAAQATPARAAAAAEAVADDGPAAAAGPAPDHGPAAATGPAPVAKAAPAARPASPIGPASAAKPESPAAEPPPGRRRNRSLLERLLRRP